MRKKDAVRPLNKGLHGVLAAYASLYPIYMA